MLKQMKNYPKNAKNAQYGRACYGRMVLEEYQNTIKDFENADNKQFAARLLKERFKIFCKEIKDDFRARFHSPRHTVLLDDDIVETTNQLNSWMTLR